MDIRDLREGIEVWQPITGMPEVEILLRYLPQDEFDAIQKQHTAYRASADATVPDAVRDDAGLHAAVAQAVVKGWRGLTDNGEPLPVTSENIGLLMSKWTEFRLLVMSTPLSLARMIAARQEAIEKN